MTVQPISGADLQRLEQGNYRRVTFLTTWTLTLLYVLLDMLIRWGSANRIEVLTIVGRAVPNGPFGQSVVFLLALLGLWVLFYSIDDLIEQTGEQSLCYRLGNLAHTRPFNMTCLCALFITAGVALQYQVGDVAYWLLFTLLLVSCLINLVENSAALAQRTHWVSNRLRLVLARLPWIGRFSSVAPINRGLVEAQEQAAQANPAPTTPAASTATTQAQAAQSNPEPATSPANTATTERPPAQP